MKRWLPHPWLSAMLAAAWLVLSASLAPLHVAGALLVGIGLPLGLRRFDDDALPAAPRFGAAARLAVVVLWDIVVANVNVARLILGPMRRLRPTFVAVPLDVPHRHVAALLATIVTMTPGTVSVAIDERRTRLLVHVLDAADPAAVVAAIKARYERPLKEIFRC
jgi:multicomponent K+:H+ antiporter subunit E